MKWFENMKIAGKLALSFGVVLLLAAAMGAFALLSMSRMDDASDELSKNWLPSVEAAMQMRIELGEARRWSRVRRKRRCTPPSCRCRRSSLMNTAELSLCRAP